MVLSDATGVAIDEISLFDNLENLRSLLSKLHRVHLLLGNTKRDESLKVFSVKPFNIVRWSNDPHFTLNDVG